MKKILLSILFLLVCMPVVDAGKTKVFQALSDGVRSDTDNKVEVGVTDPMLDISSGNISGTTHINRLGYAPSGVQTTATDIWDLANATPTQQIWVAPTQARVHNIVSSSASDDGAPVGVGAQTIRIYGLTDWVSGEAQEDIVLNGATPVATILEYVIIYKMEVLTKGATNINVGNITATAVTDSTITAQINVGEGQTQMSIYAIPSTVTGYMPQYYGSINNASGAAAHISYKLKINSNPDSELINFVTKNIRGAESLGSSHFTHSFNPPLKIDGPAIIKIQGIASAPDTDGSVGYGLITVDDAGLVGLIAEDGRMILDEHTRNLMLE